MAVTKLKLYNGALVEIGERTLSSLTESSESRRVLDVIWDNDFIKEVLQMGQWNFAMRSVLLDYDADVTPPFGYTRAFSKPSDWVRTTGLSENEYFRDPLKWYEDESGYWYADPDQIYVKYVSDGDDYGSNFSLWPTNFRRFVEVYLASRVSTRLSQSETKTSDLEKRAMRILSKAQSTDAMDQAIGMPPTGGWVRARRGSSYRSERRGS